jgi:hypothetical protein
MEESKDSVVVIGTKSNRRDALEYFLAHTEVKVQAPYYAAWDQAYLADANHRLRHDMDSAFARVEAALQSLPVEPEQRQAPGDGKASEGLAAVTGAFFKRVSQLEQRIAVVEAQFGLDLGEPTFGEGTLTRTLASLELLSRKLSRKHDGKFPEQTRKKICGRLDTLKDKMVPALPLEQVGELAKESAIQSSIDTYMKLCTLAPRLPSLALAHSEFKAAKAHCAGTVAAVEAARQALESGSGKPITSADVDALEAEVAAVEAAYKAHSAELLDSMHAFKAKMDAFQPKEGE